MGAVPVTVTWFRFPMTLQRVLWLRGVPMGCRTLCRPRRSVLLPSRQPARQTPRVLWLLPDHVVAATRCSGRPDRDRGDL